MAGGADVLVVAPGVGDDLVNLAGDGWARVPQEAGVVGVGDAGALGGGAVVMAQVVDAFRRFRCAWESRAIRGLSVRVYRVWAAGGPGESG